MELSLTNQPVTMTLATVGASVLAPTSTVMLVDDDAFMHDVLTVALTGMDETVLLRAMNGHDAIHQLRAMPRQPDLLLCDIFMPEMDGIEFLNHLVQANYTGEIVLISGVNVHMLSVAHSLAIANGLKVVGAFEKPLPLLTLQSLVRRGGAQQIIDHR